jgi:methylmalonyl-CoA mutase N-terminal domain/subunit
MWFRTAIQTSALPLTAQEPLNNIVRATVQTLVAVLGGAQSIHTTGYDEAYSLPTKESHKLSIRTQQIIAYETGVAKSVDPLGGSYLVERLTDELEEQIWELIKVIEAKGGFLQCFLEEWIEDQINEARYRLAGDIESGQQPQVGLNIFRQEAESTSISIFRHDMDWQARRIRQIKEYKRNRNPEPLKRALDEIERHIRHKPQENIVETVIEAVKARTTLQDICDAMRRGADFTIPG